MRRDTVCAAAAGRHHEKTTKKKRLGAPILRRQNDASSYLAIQRSKISWIGAGLR